MNFVRFAATTVALISLSHAAFADEPTTFSGAYVGLNGGYSSIQSDASQVEGDGVSCWWECNVFYSASGSGVSGGLTAGYNIRNETMLLGFEADMAATNPSGDMQIGSETYSARLHYLGTLRARAGILAGNTLVYVTGGLAYGQVENAWSDSNPDYNMVGFDTKRWDTGWTAGAGVEAALGSNWSAKAEGLYYDLGSNFETSADLTEEYGFQPANTGFVARIGLNYDLN